MIDLDKVSSSCDALAGKITILGVPGGEFTMQIKARLEKEGIDVSEEICYSECPEQERFPIIRDESEHYWSGESGLECFFKRYGKYGRRNQ
jgi:hypothetical protein